MLTTYQKYVGSENVAKSRNSEVTTNRILDVSLKLFLVKGYEKTTIQDIIDELGDLSKGAIYHHFKSKEDILAGVCEKMFEYKEFEMRKLRDQPNKTGLEKLKDMFSVSVEDPRQEELFSFSPSLLNVPTIFVEALKDTIRVVIPEYIIPIVQQGVEDGSIRTEYPKELSEMFLLLVNYWLNPLIIPMTANQLENKIKFMYTMFEGTGVEEVLDMTLIGIENYRKIAEK